MKMDLSTNPLEDVYDYFLHNTLQEVKWLLQSEKSMLRNQERYWITFPTTPTVQFRNLLVGQLRDELDRESKWVSENEIQIELLDKEESVQVKKEKALRKIEKDKETTEFLENIKQNVLADTKKSREIKSRFDGRRDKNSLNPREDYVQPVTVSKQTSLNSFRGWGNLKIQKN